MSNMIKSYSVRYEEDKKTIDANSWEVKKVFYASKDDTSINEDSNDEFVGGLQAVIVDSSDIQDINDNKNTAGSSSRVIDKDKYLSLLDSAREEANKIVEAARSEAEEIKIEAFDEAKKKGYEEGLQKGKLDIQDKNNELKEKAKQQDEDFEACIANLEPQIVDIMSSLIEKITGVLVEDKQEVILYLVKKAFKNADKAERFVIRVSKEDYEFLSSKRETILSSIGREVGLDIVEDMELSKNQCQIESEQRVIDCSLDVQLHNLINDLRLMCSI